ncbi:MAG: hypothetical protein F6J98_47630 [Moorea sp. SIO4G2]|nr:hypothetical protein [Moorena sp. SIO4G2]
MQSASGGNHGSRSWGEPPQVGAASPRPRCIALIAVYYRLLGVHFRSATQLV